MKDQSYYEQSDKYVEFQDSKKGDSQYTIDIQPSKSCIIICLVCLFCSIIIAVGIGLALALPNKKIIVLSTTELVTTTVLSTELTTTIDNYVENTDIMNLNLATSEYKPVVATTFGFDATNDDSFAKNKPIPEELNEVMENYEKLTTEKKKGASKDERLDDDDNEDEKSNITTTKKSTKLLYKIGVGIADMTGPFVDLPFLGYIVNHATNGIGLHTRQFSRAFCFKQEERAMIYIVAETFAININIKRRVLEALRNSSSKQLGFVISYLNVNIGVSGTHNAPGCHMPKYFWGYANPYGEECVRPMVEGMRKSVVRACSTAVPARMFYNQADIYYCQLNIQNREHYQALRNTEDYDYYTTKFDYVLTQLRIENKFGMIMGIINWVSVRGSSFNPQNRLATSDNLGYAALALEKKLNPGKLAGQAKVVTAYAVSSVADLTPHIDRGTCGDNGTRCIFDDDCWKWVGMFPYLSTPCNNILSNNFAHAESIGTRLLKAALDALYTSGEELRDNLNAYDRLMYHGIGVQKYDPIENKFFPYSTGSPTCNTVLGNNYRHLPFDLQDSLKHTERPDSVTLYWNMRYKLRNYGEHNCHSPKPLLPYYNHPRDEGHQHLHPDNWFISMFNIGGLHVAFVPSEITVTAGRRMVKVIRTAMKSKYIEPRIAISGSANEYVYFITTREEFKIAPRFKSYVQSMNTVGQGYLDYVLYRLRDLVSEVNKDSSTIRVENAGGMGRDTKPSRTVNIHASMPLNVPSRGSMFGDIVTQPYPIMKKGGTVSAVFKGSNPRVNLRHETSFFVIERRCNKQWIITLRDAEWNTRFIFDKKEMNVNVLWSIPKDALDGIYRVRYFAYLNRKDILAVTRNFNVN